ncbi:MAG: hypothetical protein KAI97_07610 [Gemmatimonadetes bacterium]|nr:hypothetical protein [Gemmatimonadota bacterium]
MNDDRIDTIRRWLGAGEPSGFGLFFASRVMRRIQDEKAPNGVESIDAALRWGFLRVATAAAVLTIAVGAYNAMEPGNLGVYTSTLESVLGFPSQSLETLFLLSGA